jgi:hypothetical protein
MNGIKNVDLIILPTRGEKRKCDLTFCSSEITIPYTGDASSSFCVFLS